MRTGPPTSPLTPQQAALITAIKRKISLRPIREDHPHFDGGNPLSVPGNFPSTLTRSDPSSDPPRYNIAIPFWEAVGPWDVDNDNDGVPDSIWVDLGDPILELEDGTRYKALYSFLIIDLDSRLNVNAHGLAEQLLPPLNDVVKTTYFDPTRTMPNWPGNLTHNPCNQRWASGRLRCRWRAVLGYGPPEISLRPLFPIPWQRLDGTLDTRINRARNRSRRSTASPHCWRAGLATTDGRSPASSAS